MRLLTVYTALAATAALAAADKCDLAGSAAKCNSVLPEGTNYMYTKRVFKDVTDDHRLVYTMHMRLLAQPGKYARVHILVNRSFILRDTHARMGTTTEYFAIPGVTNNIDPNTCEISFAGAWAAPWLHESYSVDGDPITDAEDEFADVNDISNGQDEYLLKELRGDSKHNGRFSAKIVEGGAIVIGDDSFELGPIILKPSVEEGTWSVMTLREQYRKGTNVGHMDSDLLKLVFAKNETNNEWQQVPFDDSPPGPPANPKTPWQSCSRGARANESVMSSVVAKGHEGSAKLVLAWLVVGVLIGLC